MNPTPGVSYGLSLLAFRWSGDGVARSSPFATIQPLALGESAGANVDIRARRPGSRLWEAFVGVWLIAKGFNPSGVALLGKDASQIERLR